MANRIHPTAVIGDGVELGDDNVIGPYTVILGPCTIGNGNWIGPHVGLGAPAEDRDAPEPVAWEGELAGCGVTIGDGNRFREFVSIHQGTKRTTTIGDGCFLLAGTHVAHDGVLGTGVTLSCGAQLGGHTTVWDHANIGMGTVVHQHSVIGPGAMVGMGGAVRREVVPFSVTVGNPQRVVKINRVGLRRRGCPDAVIDAMEPLVVGERGAGLHEVAGLPADLAAVLTRWAQRG
jgi:UDP-N-acetylglucosamine acyltransferase